LDFGYAVYFQKPKSFTGEDVVEFHLHGGNFLLRKILSLILEQGIRFAEKGEFSRQAVLNGKIDLIQAEGINDLINSENFLAHHQAVYEAEGKYSKKIRELVKILKNVMSLIILDTDFEESAGSIDSAKIKKELNRFLIDVSELIESFNTGKKIKQGIQIAITGAPNVGKSSLLNLLLDEQRAIVTEIPGTTRDYIQEHFEIDGIPMCLVDTAGLRETEDIIEAEGVKRSQEILEKADMVIMMADHVPAVTQGFASLRKNENIINVLNKIDLVEKKPKGFDIYLSCKTKEGLKSLLKVIKEKSEKLFHKPKSGEIILQNIRHERALVVARELIQGFLIDLKKGIPIDVLEVNLKVAISKLGELTGEEVSEELINNIFEKFCLGK